MIELPIRRLRDDAVVPRRAYAGDAGQPEQRVGQVGFRFTF